MPEQTQNHALDRLLELRDDLSGDDFVLGVMQRVRHERRSRKVILMVFGLVGAAFGLTGAVLLADPIARLFTSLPLTGTMQAVLVVVAAAAFYGWIMNEDISLHT